MLNGHVVIVTGGATGIGRGIAGVLTEKGARVAIVQPELAQAQAAAETLPGARGFSADIRYREQVEAMVTAVVAEFGRVDALVNNAAVVGRAAVSPFLSTPPEQVEQILDVNLLGTIWCCQAVARHWVATQQAGNIVNIASTGAFAAQELASIYCASKAAQVGLARSMALELAAHRIRVNTVAPGDILTETCANIGEELQDSGSSGLYVRRTPLGRRGSPQDIGHAVAYLLSPEAGFITGAVIQADGGLLTY